MNTIYILIGPPGVGKSTWVVGRNPESHVLSTDNIIQSIADREGKTYDHVWSSSIGPATHQMWEDYRRILRQTHDQPFNDVIVDRTNMSKRARKQYFQNCPRPASGKYKWVAVVFNPPAEEEWNRRLNSRPGKTIPPAVMKSMKDAYEAPSFDEGFDVIMEIDA